MTRPSHHNTHSCPCSLPFPQPVSFHTHLFPLSLRVGVCESLSLLLLSSSLSLIPSIGEVFSHVLSIMSGSHWEKSHTSNLCQPDNLVTPREGGRKREMCFSVKVGCGSFCEPLICQWSREELKKCCCCFTIGEGFSSCLPRWPNWKTNKFDGCYFFKRIIFANVSPPTLPQLARACREGWKTSVIHGRLF